jgi:hypothetical protein
MNRVGSYFLVADWGTQRMVWEYVHDGLEDG